MGHTFSVKPREGTSCFLFLVDITFSEPSSHPFVMRFTHNVMVYWRIWRGKPLPDSLLQFITCEDMLAWATQDWDIKRNKCFILFMLSTISCSLTLFTVRRTWLRSVNETHQEPLGYYLLMFSYLSMGTLSTAQSTSSERFTDLPWPFSCHWIDHVRPPCFLLRPPWYALRSFVTPPW